jgi:mono/diheme cytochrome c family protein
MIRISPAIPIAVLAFIYVAAAMPLAVVSQRPAQAAATANGQRLFNQSCSACHDTHGTATKSGPELKSYSQHQPHPTDAQMHSIIEQGKGKMPAFSTLSKAQTDDLVAYLKTL